MFACIPAAEAQFFWSPWFQEQQPKRPKARTPKPKPPGNDLPPIVPKESLAPPPPDDRPYDAKLLRLAEILGAVHYLRELCGAQEGQLWRNQMKDVLRNEGSTAVRRAKLVNSFNDGYRGYRRTYRTCTSSATLAITRFSTEGAQIAVALANPSSAYANRNAPAGTGPETPAGESAPASGEAAPAQGTASPQNEANANPAAPSGEAAPAGAAAATSGPAAAVTAPAATQGEAAPGTAGTTQSQPQAASTGEAQANPDAAAEPEQPRKKKRRVQRKPREVPRSTGFFFRN